MFNKSKSFTHKNSKGKEYYLNAQAVTLNNGKERTIYYFSKDYRKETASALPEGMEVVENPRNGFLTLKKVV